jgi:hypothetical protein
MSAAYRCRLGEFEIAKVLEMIGHLTVAEGQSGFATHYNKQIDAWRHELKILSDLAAALFAWSPDCRNWHLLIEFEIPRRQKRPDVILLAGPIVFVIEFKIGKDTFVRADEWQVQSYALDLRDFHEASHDRVLVPILVATEAPSPESSASNVSCASGVAPLRKANVASLAECIIDASKAFALRDALPIDPVLWEGSPYRPTLTIIEAAERLYAGMGVADISHKFATNLNETCNAILQAVHEAELNGAKTICFVTGTPGAGKTLAGLSAVHSPALRHGGQPAAMFLSGNGPLVRIIRAALTRDQSARGMAHGEASRVVSTLIANVHHFLTHYGIKRTSEIPPNRAIIFDEAQRAWSADAVHKKHEEIQSSEPEMVLGIMERSEWCTVVALVGEGQEIYKGEAGLAEWGRALNARRKAWHVMASPEVLFERGRLFGDPPAQHLTLVPTDKLHLAVSTRSPRARWIGQWVDDLLHNRSSAAVPPPTGDFPVAFARDLSTARNWLREHAGGDRRGGLLASSGALRLRAEGIEVSSGFRKGYSYEDWFLASSDDTRSSGQLEVAATEFECQGLELDWACVCWGGDYIIDPTTSHWKCRKFRGTTWQNVRNDEERRYLVNKYRVLLTRARYGIVIWIPRGDARDSTREPELFDATAKYFEVLGVPEIV